MKKVLSYLKPYWIYVLIAPLLMLIEVTMDLLQPTLLARIVDNGIAAGDMAMVWKTGLLMAGCALLGIVGGMGCTVFSSIASMRLSEDLRSAMFKKVQTFSFAEIDRFKTGSLITRLTNDVTQIQTMVTMALRMAVRSPLTFIGGVIMAFMLNAKLSLIILVLIPVLLGFMITILRRNFPLFRVMQEKLDRVNTVVQENLTGIRVIKAFVRSDHEKERFHNANDDLMQTSKRAMRRMAMTFPVMMLIMNAGTVAILWYGGVLAQNNAIEVGQIMAFTNYIMQILFSLSQLAFMMMFFTRAKVSADRLEEVLTTQNSITSSDNAMKEGIAGHEGEVEFENVSFRYEGAGGDPVLQQVSFRAKPGEMLAILGATGAGKSSLVQLIPRMYDAEEGRILVNGRDVRDWDLAALRKQVGMVLQESVLFSGTIRENMRWGREDATDEEIEQACRAAQAHEFVEGFTDGYDSPLEARGVNLSGGQKQRLCIARALVRRPSILIMDDSTSAVDLGTEARIQAALRDMDDKCTILLIAQRISSVMDADHIIVLEDGHIAAQGTHDELMRTSPIYLDIYQSQLGKEAM